MQVFRIFLSLYFALLMTGMGSLFGQSADFPFQIKWDENQHLKKNLSFEEHAVYNDTLPEVSCFFASESFLRANILQYRLIPSSTKIIEVSEQLAAKLSDQFEYTVNLSEYRKAYSIHFYVIPARKISKTQVEVLTEFNINVHYTPTITKSFRNPLGTFNSVLSSGNIYKIAVNNTGVYKIDKDFLENKLGINVDGINPKSIKIFGNRGGRVPELNATFRQDDLEQLHIYVAGASDGKFDAGDYILFYAEGADLWTYDKGADKYTFDKNIYDVNNYYFIKTDGEDGKRIATANLVTDQTDFETSQYDQLQRYEEDKNNLLANFSYTQGTGKDWYGDIFNSSQKEKSYKSFFDFSHSIGGNMEVEMFFAGRGRSQSTVTLTIGDKVFNKNIQRVYVDNQESEYANRVSIKESFINSTREPDVKVSFPSASSETLGWLDYIQIISKAEIVLPATGQLAFRNRETQSANIAGFKLSGFKDQLVWDVSNPFTPVQIPVNNNKIVFKPEGINKEFIVLHPSSGINIPQALGKIENQNLHAIQDEDMIIVCHPNFKEAADRLAQFRAQQSGLKIFVAETNKIYNEFSGGKLDPSAIRDMARLLLSRNDQFRYLLLFGDGTYDYRNINKSVAYDNFVPVYETDQSLNPISGFPSDDFYGLLGDDEGERLSGALDIYVGRLPVKTPEQATSVVDKIIHYETSPKTLGDWRLRAGYVADDEDYNLHVSDMDDIAKSDENRHPLFNQQKVYIDAYRQVSTSGEKRYPDANKAINNNIFKGQLTTTYLGHGGPLGWAQERILTVPDIENMSNYDNLSLFITATCSFGAYDDPAVTSPAEYALLNANGGAIGLMTTTRAVYTNSNKQLTDAVHELLYSQIDNKAPTLGFALTTGKNKYPGDSFRINSRKFTLLGDPSMPLALPQYNVTTASINEKNASEFIDTIGALKKVTITGFIADEKNQLISDFNGTVDITVFDKKSQLQTLSNDNQESPKFNFTMFRSVIFKGAATVSNGQWTITFWTPKNINYTPGPGRISYYAYDSNGRDAAGLYTDLIIGGSSDLTIKDEQPPIIHGYMNDESFVTGGVTNSNPILLLDLSDDYGINVTGNAIGQDISAILDGDTKNIFILNDFYEAKKDDYSSGRVRFPLNGLTPGSHYITAKVWDISGNSAETRLDFIVADTDDHELKRVLNYPNPFTTNTSFQFEHNRPNTELNILVNIYTISGRLIKSIVETKYSSGFKVNDIKWDARDDYGSNLARGVYLYQIIVHSKETNETFKSKFEKLIKL